MIKKKTCVKLTNLSLKNEDLPSGGLFCRDVCRNLSYFNIFYYYIPKKVVKYSIGGSKNQLKLVCCYDIWNES
jgi:hypothetical protein